MIALGYKTTQIASLLGVSRPIVYRMMHDANINPVSRYTDISEHELDQKLSNIKTDHPNIGEVMTAGHLRAQGIKVKRSDLRSSPRRVDLEGATERRRTRLQVSSLGGFVIHVAIDGFSRLVSFAEASNNNLSTTVFARFQSAVARFGLPARVRSDHGGENVLVW